MKIKDRLNEENKARWNTLQYRFKPKVYIKKKSAASKIARIRLYIAELESSLNEHSGLDGKYAIYEQGMKVVTKYTIERLKKIVGDEK